MTLANDSQYKIDAYLNRLRAKLRGLNHDDIREIVEELRGHIIEKASGTGEATPATVDATLTALGSPDKLASEYVTDNLLARAEVSRSPWRILESLFRWATLSMTGFFVLIGSILGYSLGGALMWCAMFKLVHPQMAGLWVFHHRPGDLQLSLRMGFGYPPSGARDVLGWWIVPIGLLAGSGLVIGTTRISQWCARQYRRSRALSRG